MRGRVTAVAVLLLSLSLPASPQCAWTARYSGQFRATALDLSSAGDGFLWVATGYGVQLFDISSPLSPALVASLAVPGTTRVVQASADGFAYAGSGSRIYVLRREGTGVEVVGTVDAGGTVNDLLISTDLFAATAVGIAHFSILDPASPQRTSSILPTTSPAVSSLAVGGTTLYAADGDATVEQFSIAIPSLPQGIGAIASLPRAAAVHTSPDGLLYVSDAFGRSTDVFSGSTKLAQVAVGTNSFASGTGNVRWLAGPDRTLRAADFSSLERYAKLLELPMAITAGSENEIHALLVAGGALYVAAGDLGLAVVDAARIAKPYPMVSYPQGTTTAVAASGGLAWFSSDTGFVKQSRIDAAGLALVTERAWEAGSAARVHDVAGTTILTSSGATATLWTLNPSTPVAVTTATFRTSIQSAVIRGSGIVALLVDGSLWTAAPLPQQVDLPALTSMARGGSAIALAEARADSTTLVRHYPSGDLSQAPATFSVEGWPVGGIAADGDRVALFTFQGITVIDAATPDVRLVPESNASFPRQLAFAGDDLLLLGDRELLVWEDARTLVRRHPLPSTAAGIAVSGAHALVATAEGSLAISWQSVLPGAVAPQRNAFYRDAAAGEGVLALSSSESIDLYSTSFGAAPHFVAAADAAAVIGTAAGAGSFWTLTATGTLARWSESGVRTAQVALDEGGDAQPLSLRFTGGALWISYSKGGLATGFAKETIVVDPASMTRTATLPGGVLDVAVSGKRAHALFDLPAELRVLDLSDPLHPAQVASAPAPAGARSLSHSTGKVNVLGDRLHVYNDTNLAAAGTHLDAVPSTPAHRIRIEGNCAAITGRTPAPQLYDVRNWTAQPAPAELPSGIRSMMLEPGRLLFLTEHSLELWTSAPVVPAPKRRAAN